MKALFIIASIVLVSCGDSDSNNDSTPPHPDYIDQNLQGSINGKPWTFVQGRAAEPSAGVADQISWDFLLFSDAKEDICSGWSPKALDGLSVRFDEDPNTNKRGLGLQDSVTLHDENDDNLHIIAQDGFIEITAVSSTEISAKLVAHFDDDSSVNGHFLVKRCCRDKTGFDFLPCTP